MKFTLNTGKGVAQVVCGAQSVRAGVIGCPLRLKHHGFLPLDMPNLAGELSS